jgi:hypothetical protein
VCIKVIVRSIPEAANLLFLETSEGQTLLHLAVGEGSLEVCSKQFVVLSVLRRTAFADAALRSGIWRRPLEAEAFAQG